MLTTNIGVATSWTIVKASTRKNINARLPPPHIKLVGLVVIIGCSP